MKISKLYLAVFALLIALVGQCIYSAWQTGQTTDEAYFTASGYAMVRYNNYDFLGEQPPVVSQIAALPLLALQPHYPIKNPVFLSDGKTPDISRSGAKFLYQMRNNPKTILFLERLPVILLTLFLGAAIFFFAADIFGRAAGVISLCLFVFDPNILAHGSLNTTDMGLAAFYFFSIYALKNFFKAPDLKQALIAGVFCGLTFLSKISGLVLFPAALLLFLCFYFADPKAGQSGEISVKNNLKVGFLALFLLANSLGQKQPLAALGCMALLTVLFCFENQAVLLRSRLLKSVFRTMLAAGLGVCFLFSYKLNKKYGIRVSAVFLLWNAVAAGFSFFLLKFWRKNTALINLVRLFLVIWLVAGFMIILDYTDWVYKIHRFVGFGHFAQPLGIVLAHSAGGHKICVDGSFVTCDWRYFFGVGAVKIPLLTLSLGLMGLATLLFSKRPLLIKSLILIPFGLFFCAAAFNGINIGLRHILPVYPFFMILGGFFAACLLDITGGFAKKVAATALVVLLLFSAGRTLKAAPDYLAYFNEFISGPEQGAGLVADSNLNWGQDNARLAEFVRYKQLPHIKIRSEAQNSAVYDYFGIKWAVATESDLLNPSAGFYAIGIGVYVSLQKNPLSWFNNKKPLYIVGKTFYIFQVPEH